MAVRGRCGLFGSGKTYGMVQEAWHVRKKHPDVPVMTNLARLNLPGAPVQLLGDLGTEQEILDALVGFSGGYLLLDEVGVYLPSRRWNKMADALMNKWQQLRKDGVEMRWTCIVPSQVVKDLRDITFETAWCSSYRKVGFFIENWYSYTRIQEKKFFMYRNVSLLRSAEMRKVYDSMGKVDQLLPTLGQESMTPRLLQPLEPVPAADPPWVGTYQADPVPPWVRPTKQRA